MIFSSPQEVISKVEKGEVSAICALNFFKKYDCNQDNFSSSQNSDVSRQIEEVFAELNSLIGLEDVKKFVKEIYAYIEIQKQRKKVGLITETPALHMIFKGNPGTGKTTVARIIGKVFHTIGVLKHGHILEVERADLVGEYIGHTAQKTREQLKRACGGVLFVDEAYSLARGGEKDFGKEAIDVLVKSMEELREELIVVLAGYPCEMDFFLNTNPGLRSRLAIHVDFPDYTQQELLQIAECMVSQRDYLLTVNAKNELTIILRNMVHRNEFFGNARDVRNLIEKTIRRQAIRLINRKNLSRNELMTIEAIDLPEVK